MSAEQKKAYTMSTLDAAPQLQLLKSMYTGRVTLVCLCFTEPSLRYVTYVWGRSYQNRGVLCFGDFKY